MGDYQFTKNTPSSFPTGKLLAKIDLGLAAYGITVTGVLLVMLCASPESFDDYAATNPEQIDIVSFITLHYSEQFMILGLYFSWYVLELLLAILFFFGTKNYSIFLLKVWMGITIFNCFIGLFSAVPVYIFIHNKAIFIVGFMFVYIYKLFCIYTMDMYLKEIIGRRAAGLTFL